MNVPAAALLAEPAAGGSTTAAPPPDLVPHLAADLPSPPAGLLGLWLATWAAGRTLVHVARGEARMRQAARATRAFAPAGLDVLVLPPWDCLPYDRASPSRAVMGERMATLRRLTLPCPPTGRVVLTTADALAQRVPPRAAVRDAAYRIAAGDTLDIGAFRLFLLRAGYVLDERVDEAGEAVVRGGVLDLFPAAAEGPYRLELDGERVTAIRAYDPLSQRGVAEVDALVLEPASEALLPADALARRLARAAGGPDEAAVADPSEQTLLALFVAELPEPAARLPGAEHRLALLYGTPETPFDYLPADGTGLMLDPEVEARRQAFAESVRDAHAGRLALRRSEQLAGTAEVLLEPERLYMTDEEWAERLAGALTFSQPRSPDDRRLPELARAANAGAALRAFVRQRLDAGDRVALAAADERERRRLARLATRGSSAPEVAAPDGWAEFLSLAPGSLATLPLDLPGGFVAGGSAVVTADDLAGRRPAAATSRPTVAAGDGARVLLTADLRLDDHVVHVDHGVGLLRGLETVAEQEDAASEYLALEYAGGGRKLVPVLEMDRVWRYGSEEAGVPLDRPESDAWQARRERVEAEIAASAEALAELARERARREAPALKPRPRDYARFVGRFPYPETDDQAQAIEATLADLARGSPPMDRLVCGDVGFGKTEVALRAAAVAAMAGRQVAVLAPTTVLVRQHLDTFRRRFAGFGVRVEQLSRLAGAKEARAVRDGLADGSVGVVVGTHALASPGVRFADLGLLVIDEEQRFGARHKAALRRLREGGVHVLTMTATPIPRTTQAALAGLQDLSVIATPPVRRQPVRTFVLPFDGALVREAFLRERRRGGRSFVVVPRVADLDPMAERLRALVPELDTAAAHGRMKAAEMDDVVLAFAQGRHDVLLATSIIETGLDIPGADTMVVWRPDRFGIAQLHQLRGRVGRGRERAVCYLLSDPESPLPPATERRLKTLETLEGLGAGFAVAARDLDLRGAGDLLGEEQAGHVKLIGTGLYQHLLERALRRARGEPVPEEWSPELHLGVGVAIPEEYVPEPEVRLDLYARLARLGRMAEVDDLADEIADRFGPPPDAVRHMLAVAAVRRRCQRAGIAKLDVGPKAAAAAFRDPAAAERRFGGAVEGSGGALRRNGERLVLARESASEDDRLAAAGELLDRLEGA